MLSSALGKESVSIFLAPPIEVRYRDLSQGDMIRWKTNEKIALKHSKISVATPTSGPCPGVDERKGSGPTLISAIRATLKVAPTERPGVCLEGYVVS